MMPDELRAKGRWAPEARASSGISKMASASSRHAVTIDAARLRGSTSSGYVRGKGAPAKQVAVAGLVDVRPQGVCAEVVGPPFRRPPRAAAEANPCKNRIPLITRLLTIVARRVDITRHRGTTVSGDPATLAHWRRHAETVVCGAIIASVLAHMIARSHDGVFASVASPWAYVRWPIFRAPAADLRAADPNRVARDRWHRANQRTVGDAWI
jgi:hypothetical protein